MVKHRCRSVGLSGANSIKADSPTLKSLKPLYLVFLLLLQLSCVEATDLD